MQIQHITNNSTKNKQNFQGKVFVDPDLSYYPCRFVRKHLKTMQNMVAEKPYDLFIKQNHANDTVNLIMQREKDYGKKNAVNTVVTIHKNLEFYDVAAKYAIEEFDTKLKNLPQTFTEKSKEFLNKLGRTFMTIMQEE